MKDKILINNLPGFYKLFDNNQNNLLERLLGLIEDYGLIPIMDDIENMPKLLNADTCPPKYFPQIFNQLGIPFDPDIPEKFQRLILRNGSALNKRKGTLSCLQFLIRELTGYDHDIVVVEENGIKKVLIRFQVYEDVVIDYLLTSDIIKKYIKNFIPIMMKYEILTSYNYSDNAEFNLDLYEDKINSISQNMINDIIFDILIEDKTKINDKFEDDYSLQENTFSVTNNFEILTNSTFIGNLLDYNDTISYS